MPEAISHQDTHDFVDCGPKLQKLLTAVNIGLATSVAASGNNTSAPVLSNGYSSFAVGVTSSQAGTLTVQRYLDQGATIPQGAALTATLTAATAAVVNATDGVPFGSFTVSVSNTGTAAATLTNTGVLLQA
ncbi:MAG: hypothetical protein ACYCY2_01680 [Acidithiobacillus ferriphilus]